MTILQAIILGAIQGITEFLPISSSGHLIFFPSLIGWPDQGIAFDVVVHMGTLVAVVYFFRERIAQLFKALFKGTPAQLRLIGMLAFSVIPAGLVGFFLGDKVEELFRNPISVAVSLIFWGIMLYLAQLYIAQKQTKQTVEELKWSDVIVMSLAQMIALIPGTSRSGVTMTAGLFSLVGKSAAAEFSFLMSVPVIALAGFAKIFDLAQNPYSDVTALPLIIGFIASAISGFFAISFFMKWIKKKSFTPFVLYRIIIGALILILLV